MSLTGRFGSVPGGGVARRTGSRPADRRSAPGRGWRRAAVAASGADRGSRMPRRGAKPGRRQVETGGEGSPGRRMSEHPVVTRRLRGAGSCTAGAVPGRMAHLTTDTRAGFGGERRPERLRHGSERRLGRS